MGLWLIWSIGAGVAALSAYAVARQISRPIERLAAHVRDVQQLPPDVARELSGTRELAGLLDALRERDAELARQREELTQNALTLEHRVEQRTAELQVANEELRRIAHTDALTSISNRGHINTRLQQEFLRYIRHQHPYCVLLMDIDHFKLVNDAHGHAMGDHVLVQTAHLLESSVRSSDFVGRFGGEEFLALLPNTTAGSAVLVADKIVQAVRAFNFGTVGLVTISIGVAEVAPEDVQYEDVIRRADAALYRAKAEGRDRAWLA
jgi:diguanylate cyclase